MAAAVAETLFNQVVELGRHEIVEYISTGNRIRDRSLSTLAMTALEGIAAGIKSGTKMASELFLNRKRKRHITQTPTVLTQAECDEICASAEHKKLDYEDFNIKIKLEKEYMLKRITDWALRAYPSSAYGGEYKCKIGSFKEFEQLNEEGIKKMQKVTTTTKKDDESESDDSEDDEDSAASHSKVHSLFQTFPVWKCNDDLLYLHYDRDSGEFYLLCNQRYSAQTFLQQFHVDDEKHKAEDDLNKKKITFMINRPLKDRKQLKSFPLMKWYNQELEYVEDKTKIDKKWTFDCMVFAKKKPVLSLIQHFAENQSTDDPFACRSIGFLLKGITGGGKSCLVTALANFFQRSVAVVDLSLVTDKEEFKNAIRAATEAKLILLFDELDHLIAAMNKKSNTSDKERKKEILDRKTLMENLKGVDEKGYAKAQKAYIASLDKAKSSPIDMAFLLSLLDGVGDTTGRIIVATTNYPELIEKALLRPGRFDVKIEFDYFESEEIKELLHIIYKPRDATDIEWLNSQQFPRGKWSPAEIVATHQIHRELRATAAHIQTQEPDEISKTTAMDVDLVKPITTTRRTPLEA